jgi:hypothetical protein
MSNAGHSPVTRHQRAGASERVLAIASQGSNAYKEGWRK